MSLTSEQLKPYQNLQAACSRRDIESVSALLESGVSPNPPAGATGDHSRSALSIIASLDDTGHQIAKLLLAAGADPDHIGDYENKAPIHTATLRGIRELVMLLLDAGADPTLQDSRGRLPWHCAEYAPEIRHILEARGGLPDDVTTAMHQLNQLAGGVGYDATTATQQVRQFLHLKDHPEAYGVLRTALINRRLELAATLLDAGFPVREGGHKSVLLSIAAEIAASAIVDKLLKLGVRPDETDLESTPLYTLITRARKTPEHLTIANTLLVAGHGLEKVMTDGDTIRRAARRHGYYELLDKLPVAEHELPIDPGTRDVMSVEISGKPDSNGDPVFATYRPNDPTTPLSITVHHGRDEYSGDVFRAPGISGKRHRNWPDQSDLNRYQFGWLMPLVTSWREQKPIPLKELFALCRKHKANYTVKYFE